MKIEEQHVFRFIFPFLGDVATFNVVAETQAEAGHKIMDWMSQTMTELSVSFPRTMPGQKEKPKAMEELRIHELQTQLSKYLQIADTPENTVKEWLNLEYEPNNFPLIIDGLEKLKAAYESGKIKKGGK